MKRQQSIIQQIIIMKINRHLSTFLYILGTIVILLKLVSCNDETQNLPKSSISFDGELSGTISNYDSTLVDSIVILDITSSIIGRSKVSEKGFFSTMLTNPHLNKVTNVMTPFTVSDSSAYCGVIAGINVYKNKKKTGVLIKENLLSFIGSSSSTFYYSTAQNNIKGVFSSGSLYNNSEDNFECDFTLFKGWTEMTHCRTDSATIKLSNHLTEDLKWVILYMKLE